MGKPEQASRHTRFFSKSLEQVVKASGVTEPGPGEAHSLRAVQGHASLCSQLGLLAQTGPSTDGLGLPPAALATGLRNFCCTLPTEFCLLRSWAHLPTLDPPLGLVTPKPACTAQTDST